MSEQEITAMREWAARTARSLATFMPKPITQADIDALSDRQIIDLVEQHYTGGVRLFRYCVKNGVQP